MNRSVYERRGVVLCGLLVLTGCATVKAVWAPWLRPRRHQERLKQTETYLEGRR